VFAARHLSKNGPASYGYAGFGFQDIMFVDVGVFLYSGERSMMRTLVPSCSQYREQEQFCGAKLGEEIVTAQLVTINKKGA
jgi:hypothetical protein